jgi:hypothetical protein
MARLRLHVVHFSPAHLALQEDDFSVYELYGADYDAAKDMLISLEPELIVCRTALFPTPEFS